ncbi:hypothetical protein BGZ88_012625, partial [Linnemannia elongata]
MEIAAPPLVSSSEFCDWRVQSQGNCEGVTYVSSGSSLVTTGPSGLDPQKALSSGVQAISSADLPWVFVSGAMGFYLVGIIYATPASFSTTSKKRRASHELESQSPTTLTNDKNVGRLSSLMGPKRVYLPTPMVLNLTLMGLILLPLISNQILASFAGRAFDRGDFDLYNSLIAAMYGVWTFIVGVIFVLYIFFG